MTKELHFKRIEFTFTADSEDELPDSDALLGSLQEVFPDVVIAFGSSIDTVNALIGMLLETRGMFNPKQPKESATKFSEWSRERDKILNTLMESGQ